jgi:epoxyqueuosine reductase
MADRETSSETPRTIPRGSGDASRGLNYAFRTAAVGHLRELGDDFARAVAGPGASDHSAFRGYLSELSVDPPATLRPMRSLIVLAIRTKPGAVVFHHQGVAHRLMLPNGYFECGASQEQIRSAVRAQIVGSPDYIIARPERPLPVKLLAARSGLGAYGRNNLIYIPSMGSLVMLAAFYTDRVFSDDHWTGIRMMEQCAGCRICLERCPTGCIREERFIIDAGRCLTLYNEGRDAFPGWIVPDHHNALVGCMRCQDRCPANREVIDEVEQLGDVTEQETGMILNGHPDPGLLQSLARKLRGFPAAAAAEHFPILVRNLRALLSAAGS